MLAAYLSLKQITNKRLHGLQGGLLLFNVRGMPAIREQAGFGLRTGFLFYGLHLGKGAVLIVFSLYGQHGNLNSRQVFLYIPVHEIRLQPGIIPSSERAICIGAMVYRKLPVQISGFVLFFRKSN